MTILEAYHTLGFAPDDPLDKARAAWRRLVKETHPDSGGDVETFIRVQAAWEIIASLEYGVEGFAAEDAFEMPVTPELRAVIDAIVGDFRRQYAEAETRCQEAARTFRNSLHGLIAVLERKELGKFDKHFSRRWNEFIQSLFAGFNRSSVELVGRYENWFRGKTAPLADEVFARASEMYAVKWKRARFWIPAVVVAGITLFVAIGCGASFKAVLAVTSITASGTFLLAMLVFHIKNKPAKPDPVAPVFDVVPFSLEQAIRMQASDTVRTGQNARWAGGLLGAGLFGQGMAGGLGAGLAGFAVIAVLDHLVNPTRKIREQLKGEVDAFLETAIPDVTGYIVEQHRQLLAELSEKIIARYRESAGRAVRLLTAEAVLGHSD